MHAAVLAAVLAAELAAVLAAMRSDGKMALGVRRLAERRYPPLFHVFSGPQAAQEGKAAEPADGAKEAKEDTGDAATAAASTDYVVLDGGPQTVTQRLGECSQGGNERQRVAARSGMAIS